MRRHYLFLPLIFLALLGLRVGSAMAPALSDGGQLGLGGSVGESSVSRDPSHRELVRQALLEDLDRLVTNERYYHSLKGRFTFLLSRLGFSFSSRVLGEYDVRVVVATADYLLVSAVSENEGKILDTVTIDQDYQVHSNFSLPVPRPKFLRAQALKHLRRLRDTGVGIPLKEWGVYTGYYNYTVKAASSSDLYAFAVGVKSPVLGEEIDLNASNYDQRAIELESILATEWNEQFQAGMRPFENEIALLAETVFLGETGRYPKDRDEMSKLTHLSWGDPSPGIHPAGASESLSGAADGHGRLPSAVSDHSGKMERSGGIPNNQIEIEAIDSESQ